MVVLDLIQFKQVFIPTLFLIYRGMRTEQNFLSIQWECIKAKLNFTIYLFHLNLIVKEPSFRSTDCSKPCFDMSNRIQRFSRI